MENKTFHLGLCLAGAVSAGAYTAGVIDYLLEALQKWQQRKDDGTPGTPSHNVVISVIGGASAGGMTGIITAAALHNEIKPVKFPRNASELLAEQPGNKFYHSWVDMLKQDMFPMMLHTGDIDKEGHVSSLVNAGFIDQIADKAVKIDKDTLRPLPPYIHKKLKIFTTLTNLEGFPYEISYDTNTSLNKYYMAIHNDYACFQLNKNLVDNDVAPAETPVDVPVSVSDGWMSLDFINNQNVDTARDAAMATGAFPVGLRSRTLSRSADDVNANRWLDWVTERFPVKGPSYKTQNIDGGTINNEPFEKVRDVLCGITGQPLRKEYNDPEVSLSSILFVDPFPSRKPDDFKIDTSLFKTIGYTLSSLLGQGRAKPGLFSEAANPNFLGQFMIAPSRRRPKLTGGEEQMQGDEAIACGALGGFSGFLNKEFRVHDYFLGRFNCEVMLRKYFVVPGSAVEKNPVFREGYKDNDTKVKFRVKKESSEGKEVEEYAYPIIPLFDQEVPGNFPIPVFSSGSNWPVLPASQVERFSSLLKKRAHAIVMHIAKFSDGTGIWIWLGAKLFVNKMLANAAMKFIKDALHKHQLLR